MKMNQSPLLAKIWEINDADGTTVEPWSESSERKGVGMTSSLRTQKVHTCHKKMSNSCFFQISKMTPYNEENAIPHPFIRNDGLCQQDIAFRQHGQKCQLKHPDIHVFFSLTLGGSFGNSVCCSKWIVLSLPLSPWPLVVNKWHLIFKVQCIQVGVRGRGRTQGNIILNT